MQMLNSSLPRKLILFPLLIVLLLLHSAPLFAAEPTDIPEFMLKWGSLGTGDGQFGSPHELDSDSEGNVYVMDTGRDRVQKFDKNGNFITKWGTSGTDDGQFQNAFGIAVDSQDNVYVIDSHSSTGRVQKFDKNGNFITKWGSDGSGDGQFSFAEVIDIGPNDYVYVGDSNNDRVQVFDSNGNFIRKWGTAGTGEGEFGWIVGIAVDSENGWVYTADFSNDKIIKFDLEGNFILEFGSSGSGDGQFTVPGRIAVDPDGNILTTDYSLSRIQKFDPDGNFLGMVATSGSGDGQVNFSSNRSGIHVTDYGTIYVSDGGNQRIQAFSYFETLRLGSASLTVVEGSTSTYEIVLNGRPESDVTVTYSVTEPESGVGVALSPGSLTFDSDNWNIPQTITITAASDQEQTGSRSVTVSHTVVSSDDNFDGDSIEDLVVTIAEGDTSGPVKPDGEGEFDIDKVSGNKSDERGDKSRFTGLDEKPSIKFSRVVDKDGEVNRYEIRLTDTHKGTTRKKDSDYAWIKDINPKSVGDGRIRRQNGFDVKYEGDKLNVKPRDDKFRLSDGWYYIKVRAYDDAGNHSDSDEALILIGGNIYGESEITLTHIGQIPYTPNYSTYYYTSNQMTLMGTVDKETEIRVYVDGNEVNKGTYTNTFKLTNGLINGTRKVRIEGGNQPIEFTLIIDPTRQSFPASLQ